MLNHSMYPQLVMPCGSRVNKNEFFLIISEHEYEMDLAVHEGIMDTIWNGKNYYSSYKNLVVIIIE